MALNPYLVALQRFPVDLVRAKAQILATALYLDGVLTAPTSSKVSVIRPDGTKVLDEVAATVNLDKSVTYALAAASLPEASETLGDGWEVLWRHVADTGDADAEVVTVRLAASLVRRPLYPVVTHADLLRRHSDLGSLLPAGKTVWEDQLAEAWATILGLVLSAGRRPALVTDPWAFREAHLTLGLSYVFRDLSTYTVGPGKYAELADKYAETFEEVWGRITLRYDAEDEGTPGSATTVGGEPVIYLTTRRG